MIHPRQESCSVLVELALYQTMAGRRSVVGRRATQVHDLSDWVVKVMKTCCIDSQYWIVWIIVVVES